MLGQLHPFNKEFLIFILIIVKFEQDEKYLTAICCGNYIIVIDVN